MRRRELILAAAATIAVPSIVIAQKKVPVIGLLWTDSVKPSPFTPFLLEGLRERGWIAGRDFRVEDRVTLQGYGGYAESTAELVRAKVDVIVAYGSTAANAAAKATKEIPVVMMVGVDPVATGLVPSLARPGGNLTGVATMATALNAKRIELLKELSPGVTRIGVVLARNVGNPLYRRESEIAARALGLELHFGEAAKAEDVDDVIAELAKARIGALYISPASVLQARSAHVVDVVAKHRLPAVYGQERYVEAGGLLVYTASARKAFLRAAGYVDRILKGARPGELAIEQASDAELIVNLKTAAVLGIKVPQTVLVRADRVIE
ncbi:MAG TPA: ABC transporter substrate-binding protein [Burkholderiales bacterium]|nr:ABC transporter substrate-binding protein [Burkholderiales bacterium]